ncbi:MAG: hypothetical protein JOZ49_03830, partial [Mycolicibacterium sp.]|nr:hypothetical protein [Mycolicibacterium sp.]
YGTARLSGYNVAQFGMLVGEYFGDAGSHWLFAAAVALGFAGVLAIVLAIRQVAEGVTETAVPRWPGGAVLAAPLVVAAVAVVAFCRDWIALGFVGPLLLLVMYVVAAEASARIPGGAAAASAARVWMAVVLAAAVLIPSLYNRFELAAMWQVVIAAVIVAAAAAITNRIRPSR